MTIPNRASDAGDLDSPCFDCGHSPCLCGWDFDEYELKEDA